MNEQRGALAFNIHRVDIILVACALAAAVSHVVWRLALRRRAPPCERSGMRLAEAGPTVTVGGALARGVDRARARARPSTGTSTATAKRSSSCCS